MNSALLTAEMIQAALHLAQREVSVAELVRLGALVGHAAGSVRVALSRLVKRGQVEAVRRGVYAHSARARSIDALIAGWRSGEARRRPWSGNYWVALGQTGEPPKPLAWLGFAATPDGLVVRPDNLALSQAELAQRARALGTPVELALLSEVDRDRWRACWDTQALAAGYRTQLAALRESRGRVSTLPLGQALTETLRLGHAAIRQVALDPLLPEAWLDPEPRAQLCAFTRDYDEAGRRLWDGALNAPPAQPLPEEATA